MDGLVNRHMEREGETEKDGEGDRERDRERKSKDIERWMSIWRWADG